MSVCVCVREREGHITVESAVLTAACVQIHTSFITVSVTRLCSPLGLELMVKLRTLLTVFIFTLKAEACDYGKGRYISDALVVFGQSQCSGSVGQSEQTVLCGRAEILCHNNTVLLSLCVNGYSVSINSGRKEDILEVCRT